MSRHHLRLPDADPQGLLDRANLAPNAAPAEDPARASARGANAMRCCGVRGFVFLGVDAIRYP